MSGAMMQYMKPKSTWSSGRIFGGFGTECPRGKKCPCMSRYEDESPAKLGSALLLFDTQAGNKSPEEFFRGLV